MASKAISLITRALLGHLIMALSVSATDLPNVDYNSSQLHFVPGTVAEYLEDPIFYDAYLPLLFQFQVPKHMDNALKIMWTHAIVCNTSDSRYEGKLCPVVHHLHKVITNLSSDMGFWKDFLPPLEDLNETILHPSDPTTSTSTTPPPQKTSHLHPPVAPNCAEILPHFRHIYTSPQHLSEYLTTLANCPLGTSSSASSSPSPQKIVTPPNWIIDKQIYYTMVDRFYSEFYRALPGTGNIDWVVTLNSYVNAQDLLLANNFMESARVRVALLECSQQGRIPLSFIKPEMLREALRANLGRVTASHMKYLWDAEDPFGSLQSYYRLPIADCTLTKDYKLLVRILIPVKVPEIETKLLQIRTFPFMEKLPVNKSSNPGVQEYSLQLCKLQAPSHLTMIQSNFGLLFENGDTTNDGCKPGQLCSRNSLNSFLPLDSCVSALLSPALDSESLIRKGCSLKCFPIDPRSLPIFQRTSPDTFLALGSSENKVFLQCGGQPLEKLGLVDLGALEIRLSCECQISYRNLVLRPSTPCAKGSVVRVKRLLPLHWEEFLGNVTKNGEQDDWILSRMAELKEKYYHYDHEDLDKKALENDDKTKSDKQVSVQPLDSGLSGGVVVQLCILWILVLGLIGWNAGLGWKVHQLLHWRKIQVYKDTRIVYSVPPSPQFPNKF